MPIPAGQGIDESKGFLVVGFGRAAVGPAFLAGHHQTITGKLLLDPRRSEILKLYLERLGISLIKFGGKVTGRSERLPLPGRFHLLQIFFIGQNDGIMQQVIAGFHRSKRGLPDGGGQSWGGSGRSRRGICRRSCWLGCGGIGRRCRRGWCCCGCVGRGSRGGWRRGEGIGRRRCRRHWGGGRGGCMGCGRCCG